MHTHKDFKFLLATQAFDWNLAVIQTYCYKSAYVSIDSWNKRTSLPLQRKHVLIQGCESVYHQVYNKNVFTNSGPRTTCIKLQAEISQVKEVEPLCSKTHISHLLFLFFFKLHVSSKNLWHLPPTPASCLRQHCETKSRVQAK